MTSSSGGLATAEIIDSVNHPVVTFQSSGIFCRDGIDWKRIEWPGERLFVADLQKASRILFEAYTYVDGGQLLFSDWFCSLERDSIQLRYFLEFDAQYDIAHVIRRGWMWEYRHLQESGEGGMRNDYWTLRKAFIVGDRARTLAEQIDKDKAPQLHASLVEASAHFDVLAREIIERSAPDSLLVKQVP